MEENTSLRNTLLFLIVADVVVFILGLLIDSFSGLFSVLLLFLMVITGFVWSELRRREQDGEETQDNYSEW